MGGDWASNPAHTKSEANMARTPGEHEVGERVRDEYHYPDANTVTQSGLDAEGRVNTHILSDPDRPGLLRSSAI